MFETDTFKEQLREVIASEAGRQRMGQYYTNIVDYLQSLATQNESALMESEMRKIAAERRGIPDALQSVRTLVKDAAVRAAADNRTTLTLEDVSAAYQAQLCRVWPFCR